ncbi:MFS transporter [Streptomyces sp. V4-01]|uniref:MFS transporter n=1 Tax=Actinacidiphila polyblastidii TaxID=3110430 RepID=A0ABU7P5V1_9ACTN|nr:MFS transporter [Streptomyces sp. V4-01]
MSSPAGAGASYRAALTLPHARGPFGAAMLARLSYGLLSLPLLLSLRQATGSYGVAGAAAGLFGLLSAVLGPARARMVARRPRTLLPLATCYGALLAAIAAAGATGAARWLALVLAVAAGACPPPVGPLMRTLWGVLAPDDELRQRALSLDTVAESTVFAVGPVLGGLLIGGGSAPLALAVCAALVVVGFAAFSRALRLLPSPARGPVESGPAAAAGSPLRHPGFAALLLVVLGTGGALALEEVAAVAAWGASATGSLMALFSVGGVLGGLLYGRRTWRAGPVRRLGALSAAGAVSFAAPAVLHAVPAAGVALLCAGACVDTLLITSYLLVNVLVPANSHTVAGAWVNTAFNLGVALGTGAAGLLTDRLGASAVFTAAALTAAAAAATAAPAAAARRPASPTPERLATDAPSTK